MSVRYAEKSVRPHWPRSIRARVTLVAMGVIGPLLLVAVVATAAVLHTLVDAHLADVAGVAARHVAAQAATGRLPDPIPEEQGVRRIQVVSDDTGRVVASSVPIRAEPPLTRVKPSRDDGRVEDRVCHGHGLVPDCLTIVGFDTPSAAYGDVTVYAAVNHPWVLGSFTFEVVLAGLCALVLLLITWVIWRAVDRALRPVARIEAEMAEITASDLSRRMPVPRSGDEVARLAGTVNATLNRLERSVAQQRAFVADASHELRTPITGLRTRIEVALADPADADLLATLRDALRDTERLQRIVEDLFALARLDSGVQSFLEPVDLGALVELELGRRRARVPVTAKVESGVMVQGNGPQLSRALANLLANADRHAVASIDVEARGERDEAIVEVYDDGPGIPPADRDRVFERFTRLDTARSRADGGSGLGLTIAREIVVAHRGRLYVADSLHGARLVLRLPRLG